MGTTTFTLVIIWLVANEHEPKGSEVYRLPGLSQKQCEQLAQVTRRETKIEGAFCVPSGGQGLSLMYAKSH
jgi:hypothetical protein